MSKIKPVTINQNNYEINITYGSKKKTNIYTNVFIKNKSNNESFLISCLTSYTILNSSTNFVYINYRKEANKEIEVSRNEFKNITRIDPGFILTHVITFIDNNNIDNTVYKYL